MTKPQLTLYISPKGTTIDQLRERKRNGRYWNYAGREHQIVSISPLMRDAGTGKKVHRIIIEAI